MPYCRFLKSSAQRTDRAALHKFEHEIFRKAIYARLIEPLSGIGSKQQPGRKPLPAQHLKGNQDEGCDAGQTQEKEHQVLHHLSS
jgi:hypothetical protein